MRLNTRFTRSEQGSLSIEAVLAIPILTWAIVATFVFFDAFKTQNVSQKATYTIADMISREEAPVDADYMTAMYELYDYLSGDAGENALRTSVVEMTEDEATGVNQLALVWSHGINTDEYENLDLIEDLRHRIAPAPCHLPSTVLTPLGLSWDLCVKSRCACCAADAAWLPRCWRGEL